MNEKIIAKAVRVEIEERSGTYFLVFEIVDESFRAKIKNNWTQDLKLKILGKDLIEV